MSDKHTESLYAFMDGELGEHETRFLLRALDNDPALRARWQRFHQSRTLYHEPISVDASSLADRIAAELEDEALPEFEPATRTHRWYKPLAGMAVAASVVFGAFSYLQIGQDPISTTTVVEAGRAELNPQPFDENEPVIRHSAETVAETEWDPRLQSYLMRHSPGVQSITIKKPDSLHLRTQYSRD